MKTFFGVLGLSSAMLLNLFAEKAGKTSEQRFWDWFTPKSKAYAKIFSWEEREKEEGNPDTTPSGIAFKEISGELEKVNPSFSAFLGGGLEGEKREFIITVFGDSELFDEVDAFVENAPENEHWQFIALKPKILVDPGTVIRTGSAEIPLDDARFTSRKNKDGRVDIIVYLHPEIDSETPRAVGFARSLSIDMVGERLAGTAMGEVTIEKLTDAPDDAEPFLKLGDKLEEMMKKSTD